MNIRLFQELMELNLAFEQVIHGLQRMEKVKLYLCLANCNFVIPYGQKTRMD
jgi:hypothetical protein